MHFKFPEKTKKHLPISLCSLVVCSKLKVIFSVSFNFFIISWVTLASTVFEYKKIIKKKN